MAGKKWSDDEIQFVKDNCISMTCKSIGIKLGRTERAVEHLSAKLKIARQASVGEKFGRLTIINKDTVFKYGQNVTMANCKCECGKDYTARLTSITNGRIISCGCWKAEQASKRTKKRNYLHGKGNFSYRLYRIWSAMKTRCYNKNTREWHNYGGRGIIIIKDWLESFENFESWALQSGYKDNLSIDRIDVNGNYEPSNCRWVDAKTQARNRRNNRQDTVKITAFGETKSVIDWLQDNRCNLKTTTGIIYRIGAGWTPEDAISKPSERK